MTGAFASVPNSVGLLNGWTRLVRRVRKPVQQMGKRATKGWSRAFDGRRLWSRDGTPVAAPFSAVCVGMVIGISRSRHVEVLNRPRKLIAVVHYSKIWTKEQSTAVLHSFLSLPRERSLALDGLHFVRYDLRQTIVPLCRSCGSCGTLGPVFNLHCRCGTEAMYSLEALYLV